MTLDSGSDEHHFFVSAPETSEREVHAAVAAETADKVHDDMAVAAERLAGGAA